MIRYLLFIALIYSLLGLNWLNSAVLRVGTNMPFTDLNSAAKQANPGDTIEIKGGVYSGTQLLYNLQGSSDAYIVIRAAENEEVLFRGGTEAIHCTDVAYVKFEGLRFEGQSANGVNIDDGGSYETPSHDIFIEECFWLGMDALGNNDELKLSGVDFITIRNCVFANGSQGGSLIDMVGCHDVLVEKNTFIGAGSNSIQMKGGSSGITVYRNKFINGGLRSLNIGGSTGLQFFRPNWAKYEAMSITVFANLFWGSDAPVAFVGSLNSLVANNTIIEPNRWAVRILQENISEGFVSCSYNEFSNNIVNFRNNAISEGAVNIGPNTLPATFIFDNNLWFNSDNPQWSSLNNNITHRNSILGSNPQFISLIDSNLNLKGNSPAIGKGKAIENVYNDFAGNLFAAQPSIGAYEWINPSNIGETFESEFVSGFSFDIEQDLITIDFSSCVACFPLELYLFDIAGNIIAKQIIDTLSVSVYSFDSKSFQNGTYVAVFYGKNVKESFLFQISR